jgi:hypothetical protein
MEINSRELQKFLDVFGPVVATLPAVINAAEKKEELGRHIAILEGRRDAAVADAAKVTADSVAAVAQANTDLKDIAAQKAALAQEIKASAADNKAKIAEAKKVAQVSIDEVNAGVEQAKVAAADEVAKIEAQKTEAWASLAAASADLTAQIADLEKRKTAAEKALDTLRAKLG